MSLLHPIATSLNNNVDGLQFWNCSLNTGLSLVYLTALWLRISLDDCHKQQVWVFCKYQQNGCDIWCLHHATSVQKKKVESSGPQHAAPHTRIKQKQNHATTIAWQKHVWIIFRCIWLFSCSSCWARIGFYNKSNHTCCLSANCHQ